jgi:hypothetical protein
MEVTVQIPDQFVEQLIPAGKDASRLLLEELVDGAYLDGRIDAAQATEILGRAPKSTRRRKTPKPQALETRSSDLTPEWINDPEQVRLHAAVEKFIGCLDDPDLPRSDRVREAMQKSLSEQYEREHRVG